MYTKENISSDYKIQFLNLGIKDEDIMVDVLNCLREITGICYSAYRSKIKS